jgi:hypothetical protein
MPTIKTPLSQREDSQKPKRNRNRKTFPTSKEVREALENVNETDKKMLKIDEKTYIVVDKSKIETSEKAEAYRLDYLKRLEKTRQRKDI